MDWAMPCLSPSADHAGLARGQGEAVVLGRGHDGGHDDNNDYSSDDNSERGISRQYLEAIEALSKFAHREAVDFLRYYAAQARQAPRADRS